MRPIRLTTEDGLTLTSWYRPAEPGQPTMVYFQGNGGNIAGRAFKVRPYLDAGFGMLLVGYRGYGGNPGKPSEQGLYADGRAQFEFLEGQGIGPESWVVYGESLGAGVAVQLAMEQARKSSLGAVVLEAPFTSLSDVAAVHYPFVPARVLIKDRFESIAKIDKVKAPVFIVNGDRDGVIPPEQGKRLFRAAIEPKEGHWIPGAGHNNLYDYGVSGMVIEFIRKTAATAK
jgi:fermentation-respiration switch protein FrsA (DUF1100 family)